MFGGGRIHDAHGDPSTRLEEPEGALIPVLSLNRERCDHRCGSVDVVADIDDLGDHAITIEGIENPITIGSFGTIHRHGILEGAIDLLGQLPAWIGCRESNPSGAWQEDMGSTHICEGGSASSYFLLRPSLNVNEISTEKPVAAADAKESG